VWSEAENPFPVALPQRGREPWRRREGRRRDHAADRARLSGSDPSSEDQRSMVFANIGVFFVDEPPKEAVGI